MGEEGSVEHHTNVLSSQGYTLQVGKLLAAVHHSDDAAVASIDGKATGGQVSSSRSLQRCIRTSKYLFKP